MINNNSDLLKNCFDLLNNMFDEKNFCFSYSTKLMNDKFFNDFSNELFIRYSINTYLGLMKYNKVFSDNLFEDEFDNFYKKNKNRITNIGDKGLLLYLLSMIYHEDKNNLANELSRIDKLQILNCNLQEISWLLLGFVKYFEYTKNDKFIYSSNKIFKLIMNNFFIRDTLFPKHSTKNDLRSSFVSFGGIVYFLKVLYEYANVFNDNYALTIFKELTKIIINLQAVDGSWGWFYDNKNSTVVDWFQIYSVHQDSMAFLFLFPALKLNLDDAKKAAIKSINWLFGDNFYAENMILQKPFFIYRSIKRKYLTNEKFERLLRSYKNKIFNKTDKFPNSKLVEINRECRSYHIGWIIYAWSDNNFFDEFHKLKKISLI